MAVDVSRLNYVPTLCIRASEMNGLELLPGATKDRLQPTFLLAPWSKLDLMKAIDRATKAFPNRPFFLDIDRYYSVTNPQIPAQQQWLELQDPSDNHANWMGFVESVPNASPCLQLNGLKQSNITYQISAYQEMARTFALRFNLFNPPSNLPAIIAAINSVGSADYAIIVDAGWVADSQTTRLQMANILNTQLVEIDAQVPIIISYTTIPKGYSTIEGTRFVRFDNRAVLNELKQLTNRQKLIYGDWGSTKPREQQEGRRAAPRIDLATKDGWIFARNRTEDWGFDKAARAILARDEWKQVDGLGVWGEMMIRQTAANAALGLNTAQKNVSSRVNLHLHLQAFHDAGDIRGLNLDEQWED